jgi:predicted nucleotidyltransferase
MKSIMLKDKVFNLITSEVIRSVKYLLGDKLCKVILYGSYARGDNGEDSDIDIMVLADVKQEECSRYLSDFFALTRDLEIDNNIFISVFMYNRDLFYERLPILPFNQNVLKDGIELYAK